MTGNIEEAKERKRKMYKLTLVYPSPRNQIKREGLFFFLSASWREDRREAAALVSSALVMSFLYTSDDPAWLACVRRLGKRAVNKNTIPGPRYINTIVRQARPSPVSI